MITYTIIDPSYSSVVGEVQVEIFGRKQSFSQTLIDRVLSQGKSYSCRVGGKMVGICLVGNGFVLSLGVLEPYRRQNIASNLLTLITKSAKNLHVETTNYGAMSLYEKHGFRYKTYVKGYYGPKRNGYIMTR